MYAPASSPGFAPPWPTRLEWLVPACVVAMGTVAVWALDLDRRIAARYFDPAGPPAWPVGYSQPWDFLYTWGVVPAMLVAVLGIGLAVAGYARRLPWPRWAGRVILLSLLLGPFLLTNGVFHELWGRPRPRQVIEFGGDRAFRPVLLPTFRRDEPGFPTGHAAGGFSVVILYVALRPRSRRLAYAALGTGLALGGLTAWARITQGGHFLSDGLWSAAVIVFSALAVQWLLARWMRPAPEALPSRGRRALAWSGGSIAGMALLVAYLAHLPIQQQSEWRIDLPSGTLRVEAIIAAPGHLRLHEAPGTTQVRVFTTLSGRGWPWSELWERRAGPVTVAGDLRLHYTVQGRGMRRGGGNVNVAVVAPPGVEVIVQQLDVPALGRPVPLPSPTGTN